MPRRRIRRPGLVIVLLLVLVGLRFFFGGEESVPNIPPRDTGSAVVSAEPIRELFARRAAGVLVRTEGRVQRTLADDEEGSRHQRFVLELGTGHTVLVSHNIDLAPRVPLTQGDRVEVQGDYEWNERGGVIHWTHDDPQGRREGGWIRHEGRDYR